MADDVGFHPRSLPVPTGASIDDGAPAVGNSLGIGGSLRVTANATGSSLRNSPYAMTPHGARTPGGTIAHKTEHGEYLEDKLEYLVPPTLNPVERETPVSARCVFMGHMKFETTAAEVRWLIRKLTGVTPLKAEPRAKGCFLVHLATEADETAVRGLHRRMLMDHHGVWVARNASEAQTLSDYVSFVLSRSNKASQKRLRLPKDCVTVETPHQQPSAVPNPPGSAPHTPTGFAEHTQAFGSPFGPPHVSGSPNTPRQFASLTTVRVGSPAAAPPPYAGAGGNASAPVPVNTFGRHGRPGPFSGSEGSSPAAPPPPYQFAAGKSPVRPPPAYNF
jgi:hypothetical protein